MSQVRKGPQFDERTFSYSEKVHPTTKLEPIADLLTERGIPPEPLLRAAGLSAQQVHSASTLISIDQILTVYRSIIEAAPGPDFAYAAGLRFHVTHYGMYGFAMLSSPNFRRAIGIAFEFQQLETPLNSYAFAEEKSRAIWRFDPIPHPWMVGALYEFVVELHSGILVSLHRDLIGRDFHPSGLTFAFEPPAGVDLGAAPFPEATVVRSNENSVCYDASWLDMPPLMGSLSVNERLIRICEQQLTELKKRGGFAGQVRRALITNGFRTMAFDDLAVQLNTSPRSLRRRLAEEGTSFQEVCDELQLQAAIRYLRDTVMTVEDIADALGYGDAANFRRAFRRWTQRRPLDYRRTGWPPRRFAKARPSRQMLRA